MMVIDFLRFVRRNYGVRSISIAPLITFRVLFGFIMAVSFLRFFIKGWIPDLYIEPQFFFTFWGFDWVKPLGEVGTYLLFAVTFVGSVGIMLGAFYRLSSVVFFLGFTYIELIDKTNYLNHYYFVSLIAFLLIWVPAHRSFSLDVRRKPFLKLVQVPAWTINIFKLQLLIVYFFAGLAKLNYDWLFAAMPLKLWLPSLSHIPLIGVLFNYEWTAYLFSWSGAIYDLCIGFFLLINRTRMMAYLAVIFFHLMTALLFQIGMFPYIMILCTLIFFSESFHHRIWLGLSELSPPDVMHRSTGINQPSIWLTSLFSTYFILQIVLPLRYLAYPGSVYWTEQGYRFSWRVMLMEKSGFAQFRIEDARSEKKEWVNNSDYLTKQQEKMMSTQADMILQFAHFLSTIYQEKGFENPKVYCDSRVTFNGRRSSLLISPDTDLAKQQRGISTKNWILPYPYEN